MLARPLQLGARPRKTREVRTRGRITITNTSIPMKTILASALAALVLSSSAFAYNPNKPLLSTIDSSVKLVPTKVVNPSNLPSGFSHGILTVEFSVDEKGRPRNVEVVSEASRDVKQQVVKAFQQWKFQPSAASNTTRYVLPLEVVVPRT
jgi:TonB family protein